MNVRLTKRASTDVLARAAWLVERDLAAAETFRVELEATLAFLCERPLRFRSCATSTPAD